MTIDEAIEILKDSDNQGMSGFNPRFKDAIKLGIEALKRVKSARVSLYSRYSHLLPRETEE